MNMNSHTGDKVRLDQWLWAARLFKTRSAAAHAVTGGKVHVNGARVKPGRHVRAQDTVVVRRGRVEITVRVLGLRTRRGPAAEAAELYEETPESREARARSAEERRLHVRGMPSPGRRPSKRERRRIRRVQGKLG